MELSLLGNLERVFFMFSSHIILGIRIPTDKVFCFFSEGWDVPIKSWLLQLCENMTSCDIEQLRSLEGTQGVRWLVQALRRDDFGESWLVWRGSWSLLLYMCFFLPHFGIKKHLFFHDAMLRPSKSASRNARIKHWTSANKRSIYTNGYMAVILMILHNTSSIHFYTITLSSERRLDT